MVGAFDGPWNHNLFLLVAYLVIGRLIVSAPKGGLRDWAFALLNLAAAFLLSTSTTVYVLCVLAVVANYVVLACGWRFPRFPAWIPLLSPIAFLLAIRYIPVPNTPLAAHMKAEVGSTLFPVAVGVSYLTFRLVHLAQEVRNGVVARPALSTYLSFAFFGPTFIVGPINPYRLYASSLFGEQKYRPRIYECFVRMLVGLIKSMFLATMVNHFTYQGLMLDGHGHAACDFVIAVFAFPIFLYLNFSGFCDMAIGAAGFMGIEVMENFDRPFSARDLQEFWSRWHITLTSWIRDLVFMPLAKTLGRQFGPKSIRHTTAATILICFILIGVWHGVGLNYLLFGLANGIGVATVFYWSTYLKRRLGAKRYDALRKLKWLEWVGVGSTFVYFALTLILFANSIEQLKQVLAAIQ